MKLFSKEDKEAVERVIDMGLILTNSYGEILKPTGYGGSDYAIENYYNRVKDYKTISTALTQFLKEK